MEGGGGGKKHLENWKPIARMGEGGALINRMMWNFKTIVQSVYRCRYMIDLTV